MPDYTQGFYEICKSSQAQGRRLTRTPPSVIPRKIRLKYMCVRFVIHVEPKVTTPKVKTRKDNQIDPTFLMTKLEGASARMYYEKIGKPVGVKQMTASYGDIEQRECNVEVVRQHPEVLLETSNACISNDRSARCLVVLLMMGSQFAHRSKKLRQSCRRLLAICHEDGDRVTHK